MPYKDPQRKREWEQQHRLQRIRRRRELRKLEAAEGKEEWSGSGLLWLGVLGGGALAACSPQLAIGGGSLILCLAGIYRKDWKWWILGLLLLGLGLFFRWNDREART
jgi:hypothetical protein